MSYADNKLVLKIVPGLSVRTFQDRLYLVDDKLNTLIAMTVNASKVKDIRFWALTKLKTRAQKALGHADYHQKEREKLVGEAAYLMGFLERGNK